MALGIDLGITELAGEVNNQYFMCGNPVCLFQAGAGKSQIALQMLLEVNE
jgi:hypothetical protein